MGSIIEEERQGSPGFYNREGQVPSSGDDRSRAGLSQEGKEQVKRIGGLTRERAFSQVDSRKGALVESLNGFAKQLESISGQGDTQMPQQLLGSAVGFVRKASDTLEQNSTEELLRQAQTRMRERPGVTLAGCALLGFVAARFLKA
ncbi:hypothetical protein G4177_26465 [Corallococcus sp. ZKHCc1 1396]|uniref:DUF883 family protein n=1 Tax=Corallococcus soli TaxID=2710757 RepID=A0ABR9PUY2_9BACT|nr:MULTISPECIES: hypothetical protein [Corallococcus]MBE4751720.1 hypothetical protein [Corallococcus soli]MCY1035304.1 hypothetical protein [Corallococcus sp. BB11-1]